MTRSAADNRLRKMATDAYRETVVPDRCEIWKYLSQDQEARIWIQKKIDASSFIGKSTHIHHVFGHSRVVEDDWFANLVQVWDACHAFGHDRSPAALFICSVKSKWDKWRLDTSDHIERRKCDLETMNALSAPHPSLAAKISFACDKLESGVFYEMGLELLKSLEGDE